MIFDSGQILFSTQYPVTDKITVRHSTVGDVLTLGEEHYFHVLQALTSIPSDAKSILFDLKIDWMELSDLEFFAMLVKSMPVEDSSIFMPNVDFQRFNMYVRPDGEKVFADKNKGIIIDTVVHAKIQNILCEIHKIKKKVEKAGNAYTKQALIDDDRERRKMAAAKSRDFKSSLVPLISSMVNRDGFKYDYSTVMNMPFGQFMDAAARVQIITAADQLMQGCYSGNIDMKKLDKKSLDWMREV